MSKRNHTITTRLKPETIDAARIVASATGRTVSGLCEYALHRYIQCNFPEAFQPGAKIVIKYDDSVKEYED